MFVSTFALNNFNTSSNFVGINHFLLLILQNLNFFSSATCPRQPDEPLNGFKRCTGSERSQKCEFRCKIGFSLVGSKNSTCDMESNLNSTGWSDETPECEGRIFSFSLLYHPFLSKIDKIRPQLLLTFCCKYQHDILNHTYNLSFSLLGHCLLKRS